MDITLRELTALDLQEGFLETLAGLAQVDLTPDEAREVFRARLRLGIHTYVAVAQDRIVGTLTLLAEQKFIHHGGLCGHIEDVSVHPEFKQHGIGSALVRHALEEARRLGCYKVILDCFENLVPFYQRLGFRSYNVGMRIDL